MFSLLRQSPPAKLLGKQESGPRAGAGAGPCRRADQMQVFDGRVPARKAARRPEKEILRQVMAAADLVAADQVRILALQIERREDRTTQNLLAQTRRVGLDDTEHAV